MGQLSAQVRWKELFKTLRVIKCGKRKKKEHV